MNQRRDLGPLAPTMFMLCTALAGICVSGCGQQDKEIVPIVSVQVAQVRQAAISEIISAEAVVFPLQQAVITPKITSTIREFKVQRGSRVHKGQLLAILENADLSAAAEQSKGEFEQAEAGYSSTTGATLPQQIQKAELDAAAAKAAFDAQQKVYDSRKELFDQGALPRRDFDAAEVALAQARSQSEVAQRQLADLRRIGERDTLKTAAGQLTAAHGKYRGAEAQLSYSEIRSPMDGVVTDRPQYAGELATANQPLLTVMNISHLIAKAHIAQSQAAALKVGDAANIQLIGDETHIPAKVSLVSPALDPGSTTIEVWVETAKPPAALRPGMTVQIFITAATARDAVMVPKNSVFESPESGTFVVIAGKDGLAHVSPVQIGLRGATDTQILKGVNVGDPVIVSGGYGLPNKTKIKIETPPAEESGQEKDKANDKLGGKPAEKPSASSEKE